MGGSSTGPLDRGVEYYVSPVDPPLGRGVWVGVGGTDGAWASGRDTYPPVRMPVTRFPPPTGPRLLPREDQGLSRSGLVTRETEGPDPVGRDVVLDGGPKGRRHRPGHGRQKGEGVLRGCVDQ